MDPNIEGLVKAMPEQVAHSDHTVERLYEAAQALSISEKATLIHRLSRSRRRLRGGNNNVPNSWQPSLNGLP